MKKMLFFWLAAALMSLPAFARGDKPVKGHIVDKSGNPLTPVSIKLKNTSRGTTTDANGDFTLSVPEDGILEISAIGFKSQEIPVRGRTEFSIRLEELAAGLNEVVVVG